jgi:hypothetical protein
VGLKIGWNDRDPGVSVYQSRSYGEASASTIGATWDVVGDPDRRWRLPVCFTRTEDSGHLDAVSPYGYPGILADPALTPEEVDDAWSQTVELLREREVVSLFLRFAPYRDGVETRHDLPGLTLSELSETILVELGEESWMWDGMQGRSRTAVRQAERDGLRARVVQNSPLPLQKAGGFRHVYETAMRRVSATAAHLHGDEYYSRLDQAEDVDMRLIEVTDREGGVVAATLLLIDQEAVHYHLSGSLIPAARSGANNLMLWTAMQWAAGRGHRRFHLGGGTSRGDGLFKFKASFGGTSRPFNVGRLIVSPDTYDRLVVARANELGISGDALRGSSYFPAYRVEAP